MQRQSTIDVNGREGYVYGPLTTVTTARVE
jgi:hypothetical protein